MSKRESKSKMKEKLIEWSWAGTAMVDDAVSIRERGNIFEGIKSGEVGLIK